MARSAVRARDSLLTRDSLLIRVPMGIPGNAAASEAIIFHTREGALAAGRRLAFESITRTLFQRKIIIAWLISRGEHCCIAALVAGLILKSPYSCNDLGK
jgi:hypothetical protein